jgi:hypothetical protein
VNSSAHQRRREPETQMRPDNFGRVSGALNKLNRATVMMLKPMTKPRTTSIIYSA